MKTSAILILLVIVGLCPAAPQATLSDHLTDNGYVARPMVACGVGQYCTRVTINGKVFNFMIDTGSSFTLVDPDVVKQLKLPINRRRSVKMSEMTGRLKKHRVTEPVFMRIGESILPPLALVVVDLDPVRAKSGGSKSPHLHGIIGGDMLKRHKAVIDYANSMLYLRGVTPSPPKTSRVL